MFEIKISGVWDQNFKHHDLGFKHHDLASKFLQIKEFGDFSLVEFGEESGVILDTPPCEEGCLRKLAQTPRKQVWNLVQTPRGEAEWCLNQISHLLEGCLGAKTTRQAQKQRDEPKYHEAKPSGI